MRPDMYKVKDRVYGLGRTGRRILVAAPGDLIPSQQAEELGLLETPPAPAPSGSKPKKRARGKGK